MSSACDEWFLLLCITEDFSGSVSGDISKTEISFWSSATYKTQRERDVWNRNNPH